MAQGTQTVSKLKKTNFWSLSLEDKIAIKKAGRPLPDIQICQTGVSNNKKYIRSFNSDWYQKKDWLCGCEVTRALYCFPCLLFKGHSTWSQEGFTNVNKMKEKTDKHEKSRRHIDNAVALTLLEAVDIKDRPSESFRLLATQHNRKVAKNREILSKIIDCIKFCGNFDVPLCGCDDETDDSVNPDVFRGLVNFASRLDPDLRNHLETNTVFKGVSKTIENEILDCLLQVYHDHIKNEIKDASFVAVMADDTTDVSEDTQMIVVLRYIVNEEIVERLWGVFTSENHTADGLSECILNQLDIILQGNRKKLIAQTLDGAIFMQEGKKWNVQAKIKSVYDNVHFIHCYARQLDLIMKNTANVTRGSRIFFSNLLTITAFFSESPLRLSVLNKHITSCTQRPPTTRWDLQTTGTVNSVYENVEALKSCAEELQKTSNASTTLAEAAGLLHILNSEEFRFWLELFHQIMPHVEVIHKQMQSRATHVSEVHEYIATFKSAILEIRNSKYCESNTETLMEEAKEVCDCVYVDITERESFTKHLVAAELFNKESFSQYQRKFPTEEVETVSETYPMTDKERLTTELQVFYGRRDMQEYDKLINLLKFITENHLTEILGEMTKLINILLTIPMTTSEPERCSPTMERIKTFLKNTRNKERLNALAIISTEKMMINNTPNINEKVIDLFAKNDNRRKDFTFL